MGVVTLCTDEWQNARAAFSKVMGEKMWVTSDFELQNICAGVGLTPSLDEIDMALGQAGSRLDFEGLLRFVTYLKIKFYTPDPPDMDTVRAFVAVGGQVDKSGTVEANNLLDVCRKFDLDIELESLVGSDFKDGAASAHPSEGQVDDAAAAPPGGGAGEAPTALEFTQFSDMFLSTCGAVDSFADDAGGCDEIDIMDLPTNTIPGAHAHVLTTTQVLQTSPAQTAPPPVHSPSGGAHAAFRGLPETGFGRGGKAGGGEPAAALPSALSPTGRVAQRVNLGLDYDALLAKEMQEKGLPVPRARRPTDFLVRRHSTATPRLLRFGSRKASRTGSISRQHARKDDAAAAGAGGGGAGGGHHHTITAEKMRYFNELRSKGVPAELYGGDELFPQETLAGKHAGAPGQSAFKKKHAAKSKAKQPSASKAAQDSIMAGMRCIGRSGLFVDDPPRLYPQHLSVMNQTALPPVRQVPAAAGGAKRDQERNSPIITRIEQRMKELSKKKLSAKYDKVQPRVNVSGVVKPAPMPLLVDGLLKTQYMKWP